MQVKIYDLENSKLTFRAQCDLSECFPDGGEELDVAREALEAGMRWTCGGGAMPITILERAS